ncbi:SAC3/GANP family protein [Babesia caballi]|uniref:SAC3/GANP family protein n=1 Tax=Babesia caballi TaxID=5871 RepID=A0AAV4LYT1_BABCB|nr:SAC3/GANP family protein [Babesia caballi]
MASGYTDELAASEARRLMLQPGMPVAAPPLLNVPPAPPPNRQPPAPPAPPPGAPYDRASLLSGVKLAPKQVPGAWRIPVSTTQVPGHKFTAKHVIPITLKAPKNDRNARNQPHQVGLVQGDVPPLRTAASIPPQFATEMAIDVANNVPISCDKAWNNPDAPTMDDINGWIQRLYAHHSMGACSRVFRAKISDFVEGIVKRHRSGTLTTKELVIPTAEELLGTNGTPMTTATTTFSNAPNRGHVIEGTGPVPAIPKDGVGVISGGLVPPPGVRDRHELQVAPMALPITEVNKRQQRYERFKTQPGVQGVYNFKPQKGHAVVGMCEALEKPYLRLTAEPNPAMVRPEHVLRKAFRHVFDTFMRTGNYRYIEEQFRSIRQDVQVQHLRSPFVVKLYATNARVALVHGDLDQFNQCQTQLRHLSRRVEGFPVYRSEFDCYFLLYLSMQYMHMDVLRYLRGVLHSEFRRTSYFRYANSIRTFLSEGNFVEYFKVADTSGIDTTGCLNEIYKEAFSTEDFSEGTSSLHDEATDNGAAVCAPPFFTKLLFRMFEPRFRMNALVNMASTAVSLSMETIMEALRFVSIDECRSFVRSVTRFNSQLSQGERGNTKFKRQLRLQRVSGGVPRVTLAAQQETVIHHTFRDRALRPLMPEGVVAYRGCTGARPKRSWSTRESAARAKKVWKTSPMNPGK